MVDAEGRAVRVRLATPADDEAIARILVEGYVTAYAKKMPQVVVSEERRKDLRSVAAKRAAATVLVAEEAGEVRGTVAIWKPGAPGSEAWLRNAADLRHLAVDPARQGGGLSRPLLDEAERIAREDWKVSAVCLHVRRGNTGVARLYAARGYVRSPSGDIIRPDIELEAYSLRFGDEVF